MTPRTHKPTSRAKRRPKPEPADTQTAESAGAAEAAEAAAQTAEIPPADGLGAPSRWRVLCAAVIGAAHQRSGAPCQDAAAWRITSTGVLLAAVADGAGAAERSADGARLTVQTALDALADALEAKTQPPAETPASDAEHDTSHAALLIAAFTAARAALMRLAEDERRPLRDFAATLSLAIAGEDCLAAGAVGDCAIVAGSGDDDLVALLPLERGEYANETYFITAEDALDHLRIAELQTGVTRVALFSDGLARLALRWPQQTPHRPFFAPLFAFAAGLPAMPPACGALHAAGATPDAGGGWPAPLEEDTPGRASDATEQASVFAGADAQLAAFLASDRVNARTDDDKALVLAVSDQPSTLSHRSSSED